MLDFNNCIRVGTFLGWRQIKRASLWSTILIITIMVLTFMNLVFVNGILVGLIEGSSISFRSQYSGDLLLSNLPTKNYIQRSQEIINTIENMPEVQYVSGRYIQGSNIEANYKTKTWQADKSDEVGVLLTGIDPVAENNVTNLKSLIVDGEYLKPGDEQGIIMGSRLLSQYSNVPFSDNETLDNVTVDTFVKVKINGITQELKVRGVLKSKIQDVSRRAYINDSLMRKMTGRTDRNVDEISILLSPEADPWYVKGQIELNGFGESAIIETWEEAQGEFFKDVTQTFKFLGTIFGSIALIVASITVFIVIFINAITRRKFIGIMKGIGICGLAIEISYIFQSILYALVGSAIGMGFLYGFLRPYFLRNPIDFPFSDGILVAPLEETFIRVALIILATIIAGYIPAKLIIRQNTLDAILGR